MPNPHTPAPALSEAGGDAAWEELRERVLDQHHMLTTTSAMDITVAKTMEAAMALRDLLAYANKQREIVERLPKTADGVPIEIGQVYFYRDWSDDRSIKSQSIQVRHMRVQLIEIDSDGSVSYSGPCSVSWRAGESHVTIEDTGDLYSTAKAARNKETTDDNN